jgi:hypothetical protein
MALTLTNSDLVQTLEALGGEILKADDGSTTTLVSQDLSELGNVDGYLLIFLSSDLLGNEAYISSSEDTLFSLDKTLLISVSSKTKFAYLEMPYDSFINRSSAIIEDLFRNKGMTQLKELHIYKTIELICLSKRNGAETDDVYNVNYETFKELFENSFTNLVADYDFNENGSIDEDEKLTNIGQVSFVR